MPATAKTRLQSFQILPAHVQIIGARALPPDSPVDFELTLRGRDYEIADTDPARWGDGWELARPRAHTWAWTPECIARSRAAAPRVPPPPRTSRPARPRPPRRPWRTEDLDPTGSGDPTERIALPAAV